MKKLLLVITMMAVATVAQARSSGNGVLLAFNAFIYQTTTTSNPGTSNDDNISIIDIKLGRLSDSGLYLGGIYSTRSHSGTNLTSDNGTALGASVGYMGDSGFYLMGHYYLSAEVAKYKNGSGYQTDFGYLAAVSGAFQVGVELTYRNIEYKKNDDFPGLNSMAVKELMPMLTAAFTF